MAHFSTYHCAPVEGTLYQAICDNNNINVNKTQEELLPCTDINVNITDTNQVVGTIVKDNNENSSEFSYSPKELVLSDTNIFPEALAGKLNYNENENSSIEILENVDSGMKYIEAQGESRHVEIQVSPLKTRVSGSLDGDSITHVDCLMEVELEEGDSDPEDPENEDQEDNTQNEIQTTGLPSLEVIAAAEVPEEANCDLLPLDVKEIPSSEEHKCMVIDDNSKVHSNENNSCVSNNDGDFTKLKSNADQPCDEQEDTKVATAHDIDAKELREKQVITQNWREIEVNAEDCDEKESNISFGKDGKAPEFVKCEKEVQLASSMEDLINNTKQNPTEIFHKTRENDSLNFQSLAPFGEDSKLPVLTDESKISEETKYELKISKFEGTVEADNVIVSQAKEKKYHPENNVLVLSDDLNIPEEIKTELKDCKSQEMVSQADYILTDKEYTYRFSSDFNEVANNDAQKDLGVTNIPTPVMSVLTTPKSKKRRRKKRCKLERENSLSKSDVASLPKINIIPATGDLPDSQKVISPRKGMRINEDEIETAIRTVKFEDEISDTNEAMDEIIFTHTIDGTPNDTLDNFTLEIPPEEDVAVANPEPSLLSVELNENVKLDSLSVSSSVRPKKRKKKLKRSASASPKGSVPNASNRSRESKTPTGRNSQPEKAASRSGSSSTTRSSSGVDKKIPPIKAPVGNAPPPKIKQAKSKIGSLDNVTHKPKGGEKKVESMKLEWNVKSKVGSLDYATHKPGGGDKKILTQKVDFKNVQSRVGSKDNIKHKPGGGAVKVSTEKLDFKAKAAPKIGSLDNAKHKPGGGNVMIKSEKLHFKEKAAPKIYSRSGSERGSSHGGSDAGSPIPPSSPAPPESMPPLQEDEVPSSEDPIKNDIAPAVVVENNVQESAACNGEKAQLSSLETSIYQPNEDQNDIKDNSPVSESNSCVEQQNAEDC